MARPGVVGRRLPEEQNLCRLHPVGRVVRRDLRRLLAAHPEKTLLYPRLTAVPAHPASFIHFARTSPPAFMAAAVVVGSHALVRQASV